MSLRKYIGVNNFFFFFSEYFNIFLSHRLIIIGIDIKDYDTSDPFLYWVIGFLFSFFYTNEFLLFVSVYLDVGTTDLKYLDSSVILLSRLFVLRVI